MNEIKGGVVSATTTSCRGKNSKPRAAGNNEAGKIRRAPPFGRLAEARRADPVNPDAAPRFPCRKFFLRVVIRPPSSDDGDLMPLLRQRRRQFAQMLRRRDHVGIKRLVEQKDVQTCGTMDNSAPDCKAGNHRHPLKSCLNPQIRRPLCPFGSRQAQDARHSAKNYERHVEMNSSTMLSTECGSIFLRFRFR
jgi:hypothetical protein